VSEAARDSRTCPNKDAVLRGESGAELEQRLSVSFVELVEDRTACGIGECLEDVSHNATIGKRRLA
jgi:hypothetical protein